MSNSYYANGNTYEISWFSVQSWNRFILQQIYVQISPSSAGIHSKILFLFQNFDLTNLLSRKRQSLKIIYQTCFKSKQAPCQTSYSWRYGQRNIWGSWSTKTSWCDLWWKFWWRWILVQHVVWYGSRKGQRLHAMQRKKGQERHCAFMQYHLPRIERRAEMFFWRNCVFINVSWTNHTCVVWAMSEVSDYQPNQKSQNSPQCTITKRRNGK